MGIWDFSFGKRAKAASWYDQGNGLARSGDFKGAISCYDKAITIDPEFEMAWMNKGNVLNDLNYPEDGLRCFDRALEINPGFALAWYNRGLTLEKLNHYEEAIDSHDRALQLAPYDADAWTAKGVSLSRLKRFKESIECFDKSISINPKNVLALYNKGVSLNGLGREAEAINSYEKCLEINPENIEAWSNKGATLYKLNRFEEAVQCFDKVIKINPQYGDAWNNKGNSLMELGLVKEAGKCYLNAVKFKPDYPEAHFNLAGYYKNSGMHEEAIKEYKEAIRHKPNYARAYFDLGYVYTLQNRIKEAQSCFESAVRYNPERAADIQKILKEHGQTTETQRLSGYAETGLKAFNEENYLKAIEYFTKALDQHPDWEELFYIYWFMGGSLRRENRLDEAIQSLTNALNCSQNKTKGEVAKVYNDLAITLERKKLYQDAIKAQEQAIKCRPDYIRAYIHRAKLYLYLREADKSIADALKVLELSSDRKAIEDITIGLGITKDQTPIATFYISDAYRILGFAFWIKGEYGEAEAHFRQALEKNPYNLQVHKALEAVKEKGDYNVFLAHRDVLEYLLNKVKDHSISPGFHQDDKAIKILWEKYDTALTEGIELNRRGMFDEAIKLFERARSYLPQNGAEYEIGQCENLISLALMAQGKYKEALNLNQKVLKRYQEIAAKHGEASILTNRGLILNCYGKYSEAIEVINNAMMLCQEVEHIQGLAHNLGNLGIAYMELGDIAKATDYHLKALAIDTQYNFIEDANKDKGNLASCFFKQMLTAENDDKFNEYRSQAENYQNDIVNYYKRVNADRFMELTAITSLIKIQAEVGRRNKNKKLLEGCLSSLDEAMLLSKRIKDLKLQIEAFEIKGMIYRYLASLECALDTKINYLKLSEKCLREANSRLFGGADSRYQLARTYQSLAEAKIIDEQLLPLKQSYICFDEAINDIDRHRRDVSQQELRISLVGSHTDIYNDAINFCINIDKNYLSCPIENALEKAFEYIERAKSRTFIESLGITEFNPPMRLEQEYPHLLDQEKKCLEAIRSIQVRLYQTHDQSRFAFNEQLREYRTQLEKIYDEMENISSEYVSFRRGNPLKVHEVRECLKLEI